MEIRIENEENDVNLVNKVDVQDFCKENKNSEEFTNDDKNESENTVFISQENILDNKQDQGNETFDDKTTEDTTVAPSKQNYELSSDEDIISFKTSNKSNNIVQDTDSEEETNFPLKIRNKSVINSDSEEEEEIAPHNKSFNNDNAVKEQAIYVINNKGELVPENGSDFSTMKSRLSALCDPESSDEEITTENNDCEPHKEVPIKYKKSIRENKPKKMTGKDAAELRKEIQSESQRMVREANVSLPYHKPKSHTLKEFLTRRPKLAASVAVPTNLPASLAIKMCTNQLADITVKLNKRHKELKEFYKSESESEDDEEQTKNEDVNKVDEEVNTHCEVENICDEKKDKDMETTVCVDKYNVIDTNGEEEQLTTEENKETEVNCIENNVQVEENDKKILKQSENTHDVVQETSADELTESMDFDNILQETTKQDIITTIEAEPVENPVKTIDLIKAMATNIQPRLSGNPNDVIDLESGVRKPNEINRLMERFVKHTKHTDKCKESVHLNVISVAGGEIHKETLAMKVDDDEDMLKIEEKPGVRYKKLRNELENQIALKRTEYWQQKQTVDINKEETNCNEGKNDYETENDDLLDDEEECELTDTEEETDCEEEIELKDKPRKKSAFIDEEAEESDMDGDVESEAEETRTNSPRLLEIKKKKLKRIINHFSDDSDDETKDIKLNISLEIDEDIMPGQILNSHTPIRPSEQQVELNFLTPLSFISGIQNLNSASKSLKDSPIISPHLRYDPSPLKNTNWQSSLQKKILFSEDNPDEDISHEIRPVTDILQSDFTSSTTQDLLNVCSGTFNDSQLVETQDKTIVLEENNSLTDDLLITQILEEDESEKDKQEKNEEIVSEIQGGGIIDSDEDEESCLQVRKKKNQKKLTISDDETDSEDDPVDEEIDLHDESDIYYDSEENEYQEATTKLNPEDFVENEAELSESEWGSEDEDEKGLDVFEKEDGDVEEYDENEIRTDIEKIHM